MAGPYPLLRRILRLATALAVAACACFPVPVSGIRKDSFIEPIMCRSTVQGRHLISDDNGYVCSALSINPWSHCCPTTGDHFSCQGCKLDLQCCNSYEYCVSCCVNPAKTKKEDVLKLKVAKPITAGTYTDVFDFCMGRCRHSSASVVHENAYTSDFHHCFSVQQNSSGSIESSSVSKLLGINIVVGRPGESCSLVCKVRGQSCVPSRLSVLNKCEMGHRDSVAVALANGMVDRISLAPTRRPMPPTGPLLTRWLPPHGTRPTWWQQFSRWRFKATLGWTPVLPHICTPRTFAEIYEMQKRLLSQPWTRSAR